MSPLVSVIIPTYNRCKYVQEAIDSVLAQSFTNYELIVIDDGSTDKTDEVIKTKYKDRLRYFWQPNQGESKARNNGIALAQGDYLAFLDSDDKWHPDKLKYQVDAIMERRRKDSEIALVCSSAYRIDQEGKIINSKPFGKLKDLEKLGVEDFLDSPRIVAPPSNALFVSEFIKEAGGFDDQIQYGEDWQLILQLRQKYRFIYIDKPLFYCRIHNDQQRLPKHEKIEAQLIDHLNIIQGVPISYKKNIDDRIAREYEKAAFLYFLYEDWQKGLETLLHLIQLNNNYLEDRQRIIPGIVKWGEKSAVFHQGSNITQQISYFREDYYSNLQKIWPNRLLCNPEVGKKIWSAYCHRLVCNKHAIKSKDEARYLCLQSFSNNKRYLLSRTAIKEFLRSYLS